MALTWEWKNLSGTITEINYGKEHTFNFYEGNALMIVLNEYKDENGDILRYEAPGLEPLWYFPNNGMGGASNGVRTAVPTVEVDGNKATIYLYAQNNGYAVYEFIVDENYVGPETGVENVEVEIGARKVIENGQVFVIKNGVKYNVLGAEVK